MILLYEKSLIIQYIFYESLIPVYWLQKVDVFTEQQLLSYNKGEFRTGVSNACFQTVILSLINGMTKTAVPSV
jgi:hypothetical protein